MAFPLRAGCRSSQSNVDWPSGQTAKAAWGDPGRMCRIAPALSSISRLIPVSMRNSLAAPLEHRAGFPFPAIRKADVSVMMPFDDMPYSQGGGVLVQNLAARGSRTRTGHWGHARRNAPRGASCRRSVPVYRSPAPPLRPGCRPRGVRATGRPCSWLPISTITRPPAPGACASRERTTGRRGRQNAPPHAGFGKRRGTGQSDTIEVAPPMRRFCAASRDRRE